jgi:hypothetical protein
MCAFRRLSDSVPKVADKICARKYVALGRVLTKWPDIVGSEYATQASPQKLSFRKPRRKGDPAQAILDVSTTSSLAAILNMQKGLLLERINLIFGEMLIQDIRFIHQKAPVRGKTSSSKPKQPLTQAQKQGLSGSLKQVEDDDLRQKLQSMGMALFQDQNY